MSKQVRKETATVHLGLTREISPEDAPVLQALIAQVESVAGSIEGSVLATMIAQILTQFPATKLERRASFQELLVADIAPISSRTFLLYYTKFFSKEPVSRRNAVMN